MTSHAKADFAHDLRNTACALAAEGASLLAVDAILDASEILTDGLEEALFATTASE